MLDAESVRAFLAIADHQSFTKAARQLSTTQGALSVKLRRMEDRLGVRLIERTPRMVRLSPKGSDFIPAAREFLEAHERAVAQLSSEPRRLALGVAHSLIGTAFPFLLARLRAAKPMLTLETQIDSSPNLLRLLDHGVLSGVLVCSYAADCSEAELVAREPVGWYAARTFQHRESEPLRLAVLSQVCNLRNACLKSLDGEGIAWTEVFVGGSSLAVAAAVTAGLGVALLPRRLAPADAVEVGSRFKLPPQPPIEVMLHSRVSDAESRKTLTTVMDFLRSDMQMQAA